MPGKQQQQREPVASALAVRECMRTLGTLGTLADLFSRDDAQLLRDICRDSQEEHPEFLAGRPASALGVLYESEEDGSWRALQEGDTAESIGLRTGRVNRMRLDEPPPDEPPDDESEEVSLSRVPPCPCLAGSSRVPPCPCMQDAGRMQAGCRQGRAGRAGRQGRTMQAVTGGRHAGIHGRAPPFARRPTWRATR